MIDSFGMGEFNKMMGGAITAVRQNEAELSRLDSITGDGDHGVTMVRAMAKVEEAIKVSKAADLKTLLDEVGWALLNVDGGSTGPIYGSLFIGMGEGVPANSNVDPQGFAAMFEAGLKNLQLQTKAAVGDKTMMDALIPAVRALRAAADAGKDIHAMLEAAVEASAKGAETTRDLVAKFGRAKHQGERTLGYHDPGAMSTSYIFKGFLTALN